MAKRGLLILLVVLILASVSVIGYHTAVGGAPYGTLPE